MIHWKGAHKSVGTHYKKKMFLQGALAARKKKKKERYPRKDRAP